VRVVLWADAGQAVGFGHLARTLALADALQAAGATCRFVVPPDATAHAWLRAAGHDDPMMLVDPDRPWPEVLVGAEAADVVIVDVRRPLTAAEVRALGASAHVVLVDDDGPGAALADLVVAPCGPTGEPRWLVGPAYVPLRAPALRPPRAASATPVVLVSMGGSDPGGLTAPVVEVRIVANPASRVWLQLGPLCARHGVAAPWAVEPGGLGRHLAVADLAVLAFGVTVYEALASGVPAIALCRTPGDEAHVARLGEGVRSLGMAWTPDDVTAAVSALAADPARRAAMSRAGRAMVDGRGAERVAAEILALGVALGAAGRDGAGAPVR
jgi:spore coat polysaccharide biosynthesis predicted glycosyltransferase SpsG